MFPPNPENMRGNEGLRFSTRGRQTAAEIGRPKRLNAASELNPLRKRVVTSPPRGSLAEVIAHSAAALLQKALVKPCITPLGMA